MIFQISRIVPRLALMGMALAVAAGPAATQSITSIRGLGYPIVPTDARTEVLGGLGVGLKGLSGTLTNPAAAAGLTRRGAVMSVAAVEQTGAIGDRSERFGATRFPLIRVLYPLRGVVLSAGYGGYLDQSWAVARAGEESVAGEPVTFQDIIRSTGGIGQFQVGAAVPIGSRFALGASVGALTGSQDLEFQRLFDSTSLGNLEPFRQRQALQYSAPTAQLGAHWNPMAALRLGASVSWGGTLSADSTAGPAESAEYDLPLQVAGGMSADLASNLLATVSGRWSGWSSVGEVASDAGGQAVVSRGRDTWEVGGGLEWNDVEARDVRTYPIRLGAQYRQLPFTFASEAPTEWFVGAGAGMRLGATDENPLVRIDLTVQRGQRTAPGDDVIAELTETAWRFSLSFSVFGN